MHQNPSSGPLLIPIVFTRTNKIHITILLTHVCIPFSPLVPLIFVQQILGGPLFHGRSPLPRNYYNTYPLAGTHAHLTGRHRALLTMFRPLDQPRWRWLGLLLI